MGKKIKVQRRGKGSTTFRSRDKGRMAPIKYPPLGKESHSGIVKRLLHDPGKSAPLAYVEFNDGGGFYTVAPEGIHIDQIVSIGSDAPIRVGNTMPIGRIPVGAMVSNVEIRPGDGGKIARSSGSFATVLAHGLEKTMLKMPSKNDVAILNNSRATIGVIAGGGRTDKPFMKAGEAYHAAKAKGRVYPVAHGVKMTAASHPHGGGRHRRPGKSTTVPRNAPPGKKVGLIAARSSGRKKRRRNKH
jgi:large subunit ribosomal protein L2